MLQCPQCNREMAEVAARAAPGSLIQLDQCAKCGGIWCDKWELFPLDADEADRLDPVDENLLREGMPLQKKTLYCPRCADELHIFADPILPKEVQLRRCRHCDGLWLKRGQFRSYKEYQRGTRLKKMSAEKIVAKLPQVYADPKSWVVTGTKGIFAYPRGAEEEDDSADQQSIKGTAKLVLQTLARMILGI
jgi:Zn-finger nucleic acid-binding protein